MSLLTKEQFNVLKWIDDNTLSKFEAVKREDPNNQEFRTGFALGYHNGCNWMIEYVKAKAVLGDHKPDEFLRGILTAQLNRRAVTVVKRTKAFINKMKHVFEIDEFSQVVCPYCNGAKILNLSGSYINNRPCWECNGSGVYKQFSVKWSKNETNS